MNESELIGICFLDIRKCFDTIDHKLILEKLSYYGLYNIEFKWFQNYLSDRRQIVCCNGEQSNEANVSIGVPQRSTLGPLLFLIFANDLPQNVYPSSCNMFADDVAIYTSDKSLNKIQESLQMSVSGAEKWYTNNKLSINSSKSNIMVLRSKAKLDELSNDGCTLDIMVNGAKLNEASSCKYLGIYVDKHLSWNQHVQSLCRKLSFKLATLCRLRKVLTKQQLNQQYLSCIQPSLDYAVSVWGSCSQASIDMVTRLQRRASRIVLNNFDFINVRGEELVASLGWQSVEKRRDYFICSQMFKCIHGTAPTRLINETNLTSELLVNFTRSTSNNGLFLPELHLECFRSSLRYLGPTKWNSLPNQIKQASSFPQFKALYKQHFFV